jgi:hypothetical protein
MRLNRVAGFCLAVLACPGTVSAKEAVPPPAVYQDLVKCREVADPAARLACFEASTVALEAATSSGDLVITDRAARRKARKGLFGFDFSGLGLFGGDDGDQADQATSLDGTIASASEVGYGRWRIELADGSVWIQTDDRAFPRDPAVGNKVHISRAPLGGYTMKVDDRRATKVRRVQ